MNTALRQLLLTCCLFLGADAGAMWGQKPPPPGFYPEPVTIELPAGARYTLDGSQPGKESPLATEALLLTETTPLRYRVFDAAGNPQGQARGGTYLLQEPETKLLTLSVGIDPWRLFHPVKGWYHAGPGADPGHWKKPGANWWTRRSHPAQVDLIETDGTCVFSATVDYRMFGGMSRIHPQKSFSISARKKYGRHRIKHRLFGPDGPKSFQFLVARNAGSDWNRSYLRDALLTGLLQDPSWDLDHQAARPCQVYLNGKYWGIFHLREKINPQFIADRHDIEDKDQIDLLEHQQTVKHGSGKDYARLLRFVETHDLSEPANYRRIQEWMDVDNYQRLQIAQTYFDNRDAGGNIRYWRDRSDPGSRWRWILYDVDQGFGLHADDAFTRNTLAFYTETNGPAWPNPPWSTLLQRRLLANPGYRHQFVNRTLDYLATDFRPETVLAAINRRVSEVEQDMPRQIKRWRGKEEHWQIHLERLRTFARERPGYLREQIREFAAGGADREVEIMATAGGYVELNDNLRIEGKTFAGRYFQNLSLHLRAVAQSGFRFVGWEGVNEPGRAFTQELQGPGPYRIKAAFEPLVHPLAGRLRISELCPAGPDGDWLELHNAGAETISLHGWLLTDGTHDFRLPDLTLAPNQHLLFAEDTQAFPHAESLPFGLSKRGEKLGLYAADGAFVDEVVFTVETPTDHFVLLPDGDKWRTAAGPGTPGAANPVLASGQLSRADFWWRIGIGVAVFLVVVLLRVRL